MSDRLHIADADLKWSSLNAKAEILSAADADVYMTPHRTKVVIYGAGLGHRRAPLEDPDWEVWCLNTIPAFLPDGSVRADRWFDIHQKVAQSKDDLRWIASCPVPIYVPRDMLGLGPTTVLFPLQQVEQRFGKSYWTCTFAYQIALAMLLGFDDIGLYGVELGYGTRRERSVEWACVSWWMGYATASGVRLHVPKESRLGQHAHRYGFEYAAEIDDVNEYLRQTEDNERNELDNLTRSRRYGSRVSMPSVGG